MDPASISFIIICLLFLLMAFGFPIAFAMALAGFLGIAWLSDLNAALNALGIVPYSSGTVYTMSVIPLFVFMGGICFHSGQGEEFYRFVRRWMGHFRGGLAMTTVAGCAGFAAISGSSVANAVTMGRVALPEMRRYNYEIGFASGSVAAGGTIGNMIPPSIGFVLYGMITEVSIGKLFISGILPGLVMLILFWLTISVLCIRNPDLGPTAPEASFKDKLISLKWSISTLVLAVIIIGGIYMGVFTVTEAAGIGAFFALVINLARGKLSWKRLITAIVESVNTTVMVLAIFIGAHIFNVFLSLSKLPFALAEYVGSLPLSPILILMVISVIYLFLGCVMDVGAMILLTVPIIFPLIIKLGFHPIWFGTIVVLLGEVAMITPPIGINVFALGGVAKDIPMYTIFRGILPFIAPLLVLLVILIIFPQLALFLPSKMQ